MPTFRRGVLAQAAPGAGVHVAVEARAPTVAHDLCQPRDVLRICVRAKAHSAVGGVSTATQRQTG